MLIDIRQDKREAQLNLRVTVLTKRVLDYYARKLGDRKLARFAEELILDGLEKIIKREGAVMMEWRWVGGFVFVSEGEEGEGRVEWDRVFLRFHPSRAKEEESKSKKLAALFSYLRQEGIDPATMEPGLYIFVSDPPDDEERAILFPVTF